MLSGSLVGAVIALEGDEILAIKASGEVIRTGVAEVRATGRDTMGVTLTAVAEGDAVVAVTRNAEADVDALLAAGDSPATADPTATAEPAAEAGPENEPS